MSHYIKLVMDAVFGRSKFENEVVWQMKSVSGFKSRAKRWIRDHDILLFYAKDSGAKKFNKLKRPYTKEYIDKMFKGVDEDGRRYRQRGTKRYYEDEGGVPFGTVWDDIHSFQTAANAREITGYPTQKPLALLDRIIEASSNKGDIVFDPFCGCATTLVSADRLERRWVGIDISNLAVKLVRERIEKDQGMFPNLVARTDVPQRNDLGDIPPYNSPKLKDALYGEQGGDCNGCRTHFQKQHLTVDHIIAQSKGGTDHIENLQLLCGHCNSVKGDRGQEYLLAKLSA